MKSPRSVEDIDWFEGKIFLRDISIAERYVVTSVQGFGLPRCTACLIYIWIFIACRNSPEEVAMLCAMIDNWKHFAKILSCNNPQGEYLISTAVKHAYARYLITCTIDCVAR